MSDGCAEPLSALCKQAIEASINGIALADSDGRLHYVNPAFLRLWGLQDPAAAVGRHAASFWESAADAHAAIAQLLADGGWSGDMVARRQDGSPLDLHIVATLLRDEAGATVGMMASFLDITQQKQQAAKITQLSRLSGLLSQINQTIFSTRHRDDLFGAMCSVAVDYGRFRFAWIGLPDADGSTVRPVAWAGHEDGYLQNAFCASADAPCGRGPTGDSLREGTITICADIASDPRMEPWREAALQRGYRSSAAVPIRHGDQVVGVLNLYAAEPGFFSDDERQLLAELSLDISYALDHLSAEALRQDTQARLANSEERLRQAVLVSRIGIFDHDHRSDTIYWSPELRQLYGFPADEAISLPEFLAIVHPADQERIAAAVARAHRPDGNGRFDVEYRVIVHGSMRWVSARSQTFFGDDGKLQRTVGAVRDISARKQAAADREELQTRLLQAQKLESIGRLAGGVAHDFNNMLTVISGHTELALRRLQKDHPQRKELTQIERATQRATELTRQLLAFARRQAATPRPLDLQHAVAEALPMLTRLAGPPLQLRWHADGERWNVLIDPTQLDQILSNLVVNARDAGARCVELAATNVQLDDDTCAQLHGAAPGDHVRLAVHDDGQGMTPAALEHLFEPFYTTKPVGRGTGLGMATVYGIVKQNEGAIAVRSEPQRGTQVEIYLPRTREADVGIDEVVAAEPPTGSGTVLLVDDEPLVLLTARTMLEQLGYTVLVADMPQLALQLAAEHHGAVRLLLTDVLMPGMNGPDLASRMLAEQPDLRCLYTSAWPANVLSERGLLPTGLPLLHKPFTLQELANKVHEVLGGNVPS